MQSANKSPCGDVAGETRLFYNLVKQLKTAKKRLKMPYTRRFLNKKTNRIKYFKNLVATLVATFLFYNYNLINDYFSCCVCKIIFLGNNPMVGATVAVAVEKALNMNNEREKKNNKYLLEKQLETLKLFYERKLLTKEQYDFEVKTLTEKIKIDK